MPLVVPSADHQVASIIATTVACALVSMSVVQGEWRVWHVDDPLVSHPYVISVGMSQVCVYHHEINSSQVMICHPYSYQDAFLHPDIRFVHHLLRAANILGFLGKGFIIFSLRNLLVGIPQEEAGYSPFIIAAVLNIAASGCATLAVSWNYYTIASPQGAAFPLSFQAPFKPNTWQVGSAPLAAILAAFMFSISAAALLC